MQVITFGPEELIAYEAGLKTELFDRSLRINTALFFNDYDDIQLALNECTALFGEVFGFPCLATTNAGAADVSGFELEFDWAPTEGLLVDGSYSYLNFEFNDLNPSTGLASDSKPAFTPESTWSIGAQYDTPFGNSTLRPRVDDIYSEANNTDNNLIASYTLINASIRWISAEETWVIAIEGRNLTDELYYLSKLDTIPSGGGTVNGAPGLPRTIMLTTRLNF